MSVETPKIALSHDWLNGMRGGEKCLEVLCDLYPQSSVFTLFHQKGLVSDRIARHPIYASWLQGFPSIFKRYRYYLPFFPKAIESFDLKGYDLVVSTSHCVAKGIQGNGAVHICYCFTPMRYAWGLFDEYFGKRHSFVQGFIRYWIEKIKIWDVQSSDRVDHFVAISEHVKKRIQRIYKRDAEVIYPPVDTEFYTPDLNGAREDFYLVSSALVPYKRIDLAVQAFNRIGKKLIVVGEGPEKEALQRQANKNIHFMGWQSNDVLRDLYRKARALVFPGEEDFGIVPVEMQACGGFVIAYSKGGALETVRENQTGPPSPRRNGDGERSRSRYSFLQKV